MGSKIEKRRASQTTPPKKAKAKPKAKVQAGDSRSRRNAKRCGWCGEDSLYIDYHDQEWGVPMRDSLDLFALLQLEGMQAGLSWITVLRKRAHMHKRFFGLRPTQLVARGPARMSDWLNDAGLIRNRAKLAALISNAQAYLDLEGAAGKGTFAATLWAHVQHQPVQNSWPTLAVVPATTDASVAMSKELKKLGFRFVGPTICYAFMQSAGLVNDHIHGCFRRADCRALKSH